MIKIVDALISLGCKEFTVTSNSYEGIEWIVEPETIPSKEEVLNMVAQLEVLEQQEADARVAARESAISKLSAIGLSKDEIKALVGA